MHHDDGAVWIILYRKGLRSMTIDWNHFTPWMALAGGIVLGLASALFILFNGRVLGISGIVGGLLRPKAGDVLWRPACMWRSSARCRPPSTPAGPW